jgi:hypothetical protein
VYAVIGVVSAAFGVAVGTLAAALIDPGYAPIEVVASTAIDIPPAVVKEWATSTFGTATKSIVVAVVVIAVILIAAWAGIRSRERASFGVQVMIIAGAVGAVAALLRPVDALLAPVPSLLAGGAAALSLWGLVRLAARVDAAVEVPVTVPVAMSGAGSPDDPAQAPTPAPTQDPGIKPVSRRGILLGIGGVAVLGGAAWASARWLTNQASATASRLAAVLPKPVEPLPPLPTSVQAPVPVCRPSSHPTPTSTGSTRH